ncbi:DUF4145 domain-containing protein [Candidatus Woesearchaeota archaeon]|nr:DUF4145 domain-containing protein [Candidatus Woesearchaeota archaeon]
MHELKRVVKSLKSDLDKIISKNLSLEIKKSSVSDFKTQQNNSLIKSVFTNITLLEKHSRRLTKHPLDEIWFKSHPLDEIWFQINALKRTKDPNKMLNSVDMIAGVLAGLPQKSSIKIPNINHAIQEEVHADIEEMNRCFNAGCYRSAIIICGRILETALHRKYFEITGNDLLEKAPGIGLGNLIAKLSSKNIDLDPALGNQIHLINQVRIHSVHKKQKAFTPSKTQTRAIMLYTTDVINKLFL